MRTLIINAGSTNLKLSVLDGIEERFHATIEHQPPSVAVGQGLEQVRAAGLLPVEAVGHRIVHGGSEFTKGVRITDEVVAKLTKLNDLAPLHNPPALEALEEARKQLPDVPHIAAFDTAFHSSMTEAVRQYAVPWEWTQNWGIRKYGFHGLSHAYCSRRAAEMLGAVNEPSFRMVVAHLGGGCSLSSIKGGMCVDTTMGFTPLDGLMMGTRCGSIDPGVILHVMRHHGLTVDQVEHTLTKESGLFGVSGVSSDIREVRKAAESVNPRAVNALEMFTHRVRVGIGAMAATIGGLNALVFTGGIGENDAKLRRAVCSELGLGVVLDFDRNENGKPDAEISQAGSKVRVLVIHTREDVSIVREIEKCLEKS
ncbi:MAG: acetate/propionate family kinase [Planctomycetia bacterium]|nr:acetate/propionate family kinase [Planctomycetia bacterium]